MSDEHTSKQASTYVCNSDRLNESRQEINEYDETHRETAESAETVQEDQFSQVVNGRVDPSSTLRQQDRPLVWCYGEGMSVTDELGLVHREVLQEESREVTIFTKMEKVLHVEGVDSVFGIVLDDSVGDEQGLVGVG